MIGFVRRLLTPKVTHESHILRLGNREIVYSLRRSQRRSLALRVDPRGVHVAVPLRTSAAAVEAFLQGHRDWLIKRLAMNEERAALQAFTPDHGVCFPLLGKDCRLQFDATIRGAHWRQADDGVEELRVGRGSDPAVAIVKALRQRALPDFCERVRAHCARLGVSSPEVRLSSARTRWGSCSARSGIRLHWRLIHLDPVLIDYVVAHEVAHLIEMNHSPRFWTIVETLHADWREARRTLNALAHTLPVIEVGSGATPNIEH